MPNELPNHPSLEQLRKLARELCRAYQARNAAPIARVEKALPRFRARSLPLRLAQAQTVIAREHSFASWPRLKAHVEGALIDAELAAAASDIAI